MPDEISRTIITAYTEKKNRIEESPPPRHVVTFETPSARNNNPCKYRVVTAVYAHTYVDVSTYLPHGPFAAGRRFVENTASRLVSVPSRGRDEFPYPFPDDLPENREIRDWYTLESNHKTRSDQRKSKVRTDDDEGSPKNFLGETRSHRTRTA